SCIEAILFISEAPVSASSISESLKIPGKKAEEIIKNLENEYLHENRGFLIRKVAGGYRFYSNPALSEILLEFVKSNISTYLSQAALETLAIACYMQPVTRTQVAEIRGVRTDSVFQTLIDKDLLRESGRLKEPGNPKVYRITERLLEILGINSLEELPALKDFEETTGENEGSGEFSNGEEI
ncbi:MAG: SMC-Scp complex subunit ScpB, partial [Actinobacteria bacterium]|nr:SMC-Scp complex subunit ScpB [Actinomycetota bacterium]